MKAEYDFSKGKRVGALMKEPAPEPGKVKISIRIDEDVLDQFYALADDTGVGYQTLINSTLRDYLLGKAPKLEETLRRIVREEIRDAKAS